MIEDDIFATEDPLALIIGMSVIGFVLQGYVITSILKLLGLL